MARATVWEEELTLAERATLHPGVPARLNRRPDVLIVGSGVIGLATAVSCRRTGLGSVVVIERAERLASAASGGNGGAMAPDMHALTDPPEFVAFARSSVAASRRLDAEWDGAIGLRTTRWLHLFPAARPTTLLVGSQFEWLDDRAVRELEPDLAPPEGCDALLVTGQGMVNPQRLAAALARRAGITATGVEATGIRTRGDRITVVRTSAGDFQPGVVVMATGLVPPPWSHGVRQRWVKGHLLATAPGPWRLASIVRSDDQGGGCPLPSGGILCGGTIDDGDFSPDPRPEVAAALAAGLHRLVPATRHAPVTHSWCCFRPVVHDRHPVIDQLPGTTNGWLSAGHYTTGVLMAAATGHALASWILTGTRPPETTAFGLSAD